MRELFEQTPDSVEINAQHEFPNLWPKCGGLYTWEYISERMFWDTCRFERRSGRRVIDIGGRDTPPSTFRALARYCLLEFFVVMVFVGHCSVNL